MSRIATLGAGKSASLRRLAAGAGSACAADLSPPSYTPPTQAYTPASACTWTGPYAGLQGGYGWGSGTVSGSGAANAITIGTATIPAMIGSGMPPATAAASENATSTGGHLVTPRTRMAEVMRAEDHSNS